MNLLLSVCFVLAATPSGMAPLPAQYLQGKTFHSPDGWFTIEAPSADWEWFEMRAFDGEADPRWPDGAHGTVGWYLRDPKPGGRSFVVMESYSPLAAMMDDKYMSSLEIDTRKGLTPDEAMSNFHAVRINVPTEDSIRFWYEVRKTSGETLYRFAYATGWQHKVFILGFAPTPEEPRELKRTVVSLRWVQTP
ncbi:MAG TPA: hypothetical protein VJ276_07490 [Thermoanaerobaculia bacterium]|nr:hypothetical protein [Thermoanaerobaculia bacterium]